MLQVAISAGGVDSGVLEGQAAVGFALEVRLLRFLLQRRDFFLLRGVVLERVSLLPAVPLHLEGRGRVDGVETSSALVIPTSLRLLLLLHHELWLWPFTRQVLLELLDQRLELRLAENRSLGGIFGFVVEVGILRRRNHICEHLFAN